MDEGKQIKAKKNIVGLISVVIGICAAVSVVIFWINFRQEYDTLRSQLNLTHNSLENLKRTVSELQNKTEKNENAIFKIGFDNLLDKEGLVDFTNSQIQAIGSGFNVANLEMKEHLTGIKFSGRMINTQSVRHKNTTFKIKIGKNEKDFTINMISPGNSTSFIVYVPDIKPEDAHYGEIKYQRSSIEYYTR